MPSKMKQVNARFDYGLYERLKRAAKLEKRSVSAQVVYLVEKVMGREEEAGTAGGGPSGGASTLARQYQKRAAPGDPKPRVVGFGVDRTPTGYTLSEAVRRYTLRRTDEREAA